MRRAEWPSVSDPYFSNLRKPRRHRLGISAARLAMKRGPFKIFFLKIKSSAATYLYISK
jgi:hypothetical protein